MKFWNSVWHQTTIIHVKGFFEITDQSTVFFYVDLYMYLVNWSFNV